jgi:hypothetical protein
MALQHDGAMGWHSNAMVLGVATQWRSNAMALRVPTQWHSNTMVFQHDGATRCFDYLDIESTFRLLKIEHLSSSFVVAWAFYCPLLP